MRLHTSPRDRRGSILIVVIGLLALFAVVGLSFVLYADAEATAARSARAARNGDALPDATIPANDFLTQLIFDTNDNKSALYGQAFLTSRFESGSNVPFTGVGLPAGTTTVNYMGGAKPTGKAVPWTYPDINNFYMSWIDPATGRVMVPSFFRKDVFGSDLSPTGTGMTDPNGYQRMLRPHPSKHPNFPKVPANPAGAANAYTGDVCNLKFMTGAQENDSLWMYTGSPVQTWRGRQYVAMVAPIIIDLSGRVNVSVAGNNKGAGNTHGSTHGWGQWEINPTTLNMSQADLNLLIAARQNNGLVPGDRHSSSAFGLINRGWNSSNVSESRSAPFYSQADFDGLGTAPDGPPQLPIANNDVPFPTYPTRFEIAANTANSLTNHASMFNPFQWPRGSTATTAKGFGMDDVVKHGTRYNDAKNRYQSSELNQKATGNSFANADARTLTTAFSVSQRWGNITVTGGTIGPIDLNRPLPDYRTDTTKPLSSTNIASGAALNKVTQARQNLAMDIFVRLMASAGYINGTIATYLPSSGSLQWNGVPTPQVKRLAQFAVNIVDYLDGDDVMTRFQWHDDTDVVYGTELPKLVVNEAYCGLFNDPSDSPPAEMGPVGMKKRPAQKEIRRKYWVELHNPLTQDATLPDNGAARLAPIAGGAAVYPYRLDVLEENNPNANTYRDYLSQEPANAAKDPATVAGLTERIRLNQFTNGAPKPGLAGDEANLVEPATLGTANANQSYFVIGPKDQPAGNGTFPDTYEQNQSLTFPDPNNAGQQNVMVSYTANDKASQGNIAAAALKTHTFILQRLANPYIAVDPSNPYVTVDFIERIPTRDRVLYTDQDDRTKVDAAFVPDAKPTLGKCHPYASGFVGDGGVQALAPQTSNNNKHSFFARNDNLDNKTSGLAWLTHLDRELVNATEILQTSIYSPGLLTTQFYNGKLAVAAPGGPAPVTAVYYNNHNRLTQGANGNLLDSAIAPNLYKAFDLLSVGSRLPGIPLGGREPGLVNLNMVADARVVQALLDPQAGNSFNAAYVSTASPSLFSSRTVGATPAALTDKPFQPYSSIATGATVESTLLRGLTTAASPYLFNTTIAATSNHPYFVPEPLRKIMNNTTTVTDGFLVIWTVGFFEVESVAATGPVIGKELYERVPGDLRAQYAAVVDRSTATVAVSNTPQTTAPFTKPWETKMTEDAAQSSAVITMQGTAGGIYVDGTLVPITVNKDLIRLGYGDGASGTGDGEWVSVLGIATAATPGQVTVTTSSTGRYHAAGTRVSNALLGNPGPQTGFDCTAPANRHLVPYYIRMQP